MQAAWPVDHGRGAGQWVNANTVCKQVFHPDARSDRAAPLASAEPVLADDGRTPPKPPAFLPLVLPALESPPAAQDIRIELQRGTAVVQVTWPMAAAANCAAWLRELLR